MSHPGQGKYKSDDASKNLQTQTHYTGVPRADRCGPFTLVVLWIITAVVIGTLFILVRLQHSFAFQLGKQSSAPSLASSQYSLPVLDLRPQRQGFIYHVTPYWVPEDTAMRSANEEALQQLVSHPQIQTVSVLVENEEAGSAAKQIGGDVVQVHLLGRRANYSDIFVFAAKQLAGRIVSYAHADVSYGPEFQKLCPAHFDGKTVFALSRTNKCPRYGEETRLTECSSDYRGSHDVFIFRAPLESLDLGSVNFLPNHWGAENVLIYELERGGYQVANPCYDLPILHHDCSTLHRHYPPRINGLRSGLARPSVLPPCPISKSSKRHNTTVH